MTTTAAAPRAAPAAPPVRPAFGHVPALDGLRGVAVAGVLLFHAGHLRGGFLGVDLFFVLSGFLITSLLLAEWDRSGNIDLRRFWSRRFRRLLPAALLLLVAVAVLAGVTMTSAELHRFRGDALAALADVANWHAIGAGNDYWASSGAPSPLQHMWSLSIEEQLYLAWPLVVVACLAAGRRRRVGRQVLVLAALGGACLSAAAMAWWSVHDDPLRAYYGTDARASSVLLGGLMAMLVNGQHRGAGLGLGRALRPAVPVAAVALGAAWLWADGTSSWLYRGGFPALSLCAAVVVGAVALAEAGRGMRVLEVEALRWLGRVSYGVYLWHWPIYTVIDEDAVSGRWLRTAVRVVVTLAVASLSYQLVEQPVRRGDLRTSAWRLAAPGGALAVVVATVVVTHGATAPPGSGSVIVGHSVAGAPSVLLLGDSEAYALSTGASAVRRALDVTTVSYFGCGIGPGVPVTDSLAIRDDGHGVACPSVAGRFADVIAERDPQVVLLGVGAFEVFDRQVDGRRVRYGSPEWDALTLARLHATLGSYRAGDRTVLAMAAPCFTPRIDADSLKIVTEAQAEEMRAVRADDARTHHWNSLLRQVAADEGVQVLPYDELYCGVPEAQQPERPDGVHLSDRGAEDVWRWLLPQLQEAATR
jgi:peptidoglycan/LPS O-acetylase OafA/YrhL